MKITRRLLALLLAMCMLFGNVATPAMAAEFAETEPAEIQEEIIDQPEIEEEPEESADEAEETTESEEVVEEAEEETTESEEPADEAEEELAAFDEVAEEAAYYDATGAEDAEISAEGILFAYVAEADGILTISISGNPGYRVVVMDSELNPIGLPEENSETKDLTYAVQGGETYTVSIFGFDPAEQSAADAVITYSLSFAEDTTESEEPAEYAIDCETTLIPGENALTLLADAVTTVYSFLPEEAGVYTFTADNADALVGYWGADSSDVSDITETKTNALEVTIAEVGQCAMIGISGVESCALTVEKTGDVNGTAEEQVNGEPVGTLNNPALLEETLQTIPVADNAYFCTWTADEAGTFTFAIDETCTDWRYGIDNLTTGVIGTVYNSTDETQTPSQQIPVAAGDQLMICVGLASGEPGDVTFSASFLPAPGSEGNPYSFDPEWGDATWNDAMTEAVITAVVPADTTVYFDASMMSGCMYSIDGGKLQMLPTEDGTGIIPYVNDSDEEKEVTVRLVIPVGHYYNPAKLTKLGATTVNLPAGSDGYYYEWTAEEDGYFTFTVTSKATAKLGWMYALEYEDMPRDTGAFWSDDEVVMPGQRLYLYADDTVRMYVNTYLPDAMSPKGAVKFMTTFTPDEYAITSGKSQKLTVIDPNTGKAFAAGQLDWTISDYLVWSPVTESYIEYEDVASYVTLKNGTVKTMKCGDSVLLSITAVNKKDPSITAEFEVEILPAANKLSLWAFGNHIPAELELNVNGATLEDYEDMIADLDAYAFPVNAAQDVTWKSSNTKIMTVDEEGAIGPVWDAKTNSYKTGKATITATANDGSGKKATVKINVTKAAYIIDMGVENVELVEMEHPYNGNMYMGTTADAGSALNLTATVDPNASVKGVYWYTSYGKISSSGTLTIPKDLSTGTPIVVTAQTKDYNDYQQILIMVENNTVTVQAGINTEGVPVVYTSPNEAVFDVSYFTSEEQILAAELYAYAFSATGEWLYEISDWTISGSAAVLKTVTYWSEWFDNDGDDIYETEIKHTDLEAEPVPDGYVLQTATYLVPVWDAKKGVCKTGTVTLNAIAEDGTKASFKVNISSLVNEIEIMTNDGQTVDEFGNLYATAGTTVKLSAVTNTNAKNKSVTWYAYPQQYSECFKISSSGALTIAKDLPEQTVVWVYAEAKDSGYWQQGVPVVVSPRATNVHLRTEIDGNIKYVSNATKNWDVNTDGRTLHLSSLVYPFDASQSVTFTVNNKAIAEVIAGSDDSASLIFTGTKYGKLTVTATANDGSKEKSTFTLNVFASAMELDMKDGTADYVAGGKTLDLSKQVLINADSSYVPATNQKLTWSFSEDTQAAADAIKAKITNGKLTTNAKLAAAAGITELTVVVNSADGYGNAEPLTWDVTVYPATGNVYIKNVFDATLKTLDLISGDVVQLHAETDVEGALNAYTWTSSNDKVAVVYQDGRLEVHAVKDGKATIKATATDGTGKSASITVNVKVNVVKIELDEQVTTPGNTLDLAKQVRFIDECGCEVTPSNKKIVWKLFSNGYEADNQCDAGKLAPATGKFTAASKVTGFQWCTVDAEYVNAKGETVTFAEGTPIHVYPYPAIGIEIYYREGEFDTMVESVKLNGNSITTEENQVIVDAVPVANGFPCGRFAYSIDNEEEFYVKEQDLYGETYAVVKPVADEDPYGTVKLTVKTIDGSNKSASVTITFAEPEWTEPIP